VTFVAAVVNAEVPSSGQPRRIGPENTLQVPRVSRSSPTGSVAKMCETFTQRFCQRMPPDAER
jgi:hypothetical protein